ncbi:MAG: S1C family serine protease [Emcibacteraceae bacterium]|nr:S1C family serine protease [Emcibacteraceae bacterium]
MMSKLISITLSVLLIFTGNTFAKPKVVPTAEEFYTNPDDNSPPIGFSRIVFNVPETKNLGRGGFKALICSPRYPFKVDRGNFNVENRIFIDTFTKVMNEANFNLPGDPNDLFVNKKNEPEYLVAVMISDFDIDYCHKINSVKGDGQLYMEFEWQVYNISKQEVVFKKTTEGYLKIKKITDNILFALLEGTFKNALYNLLETDELANAINSADRELVDPSFDNFSVDYITAIEKNEAINLNQARQSVVTIKAPSGGHGSGFFISENGHILTNQHVVGTNKTVIVAFENGLELEAEVIRSAEKRDVALVKVPISKSIPLAIKMQEPDIGTSVYAIGSPLDTDLSGTVSQGIISALRMRDDQEYIQSDAQINGGNSGGPMVDENGNVVAISVSGRVDGEGINFFIPIKFALEALSINNDPKPVSKYN